MTDVFIILGFMATYFILLGFVGFCHFLMGDRTPGDIGKSDNSKRDQK